MEDKNKNILNNDTNEEITYVNIPENVNKEEQSVITEIVRDNIVEENQVNFSSTGEYRYVPKSKEGESFLREEISPKKNKILYLETSKDKECFYKETIKKEEKNQNKFSFKKIIAACLVVSIAGGGSIGAGYSLTQNYLGNKGGESANAIIKESTLSSNYITTSSSKKSSESNASVAIIKEVSPSVVSITTTVSGKTNYFNGFQVPYETQGAGSGIIFREDDTKVYIATNAHVIDGASAIGISINESEENISAKVVGTDITSDLGVISVLKSDLTSAGIKDIAIAEFGDSDQLEVGESVIAIGNALGEGKTSTGGMISALGKEINIDGKTLEVIQTDAAINPGNSGGALVNYDGNVIGINTAKSYESAVEGMGYAMPSNVILPIIEKLLTDGTIAKPYLGIVGESITEEISNLYGGLPIGVLVRQVVEGGSADNGGIVPSDIITDFAGDKIMNMEALVDVLSKQKVGDTVDVRIIRNGNTPMLLKVKIEDANNQ